MKSQPFMAAIVGLLIGLAAGFVIVNSTGSLSSPALPKDTAGQLVIDYLAANDVPATLLVVNEENGLYKVTVKANATGVASDVYITKDGTQLFQPGVSDVSQATSGLIAKRAWFDCLASKGLLFYGSTETNATLLQLQVFGGTQFVDRIYIGCEGERAQACINANITEVPTFIYENKTYTGAKTLDWFVNLTNCTVG
jgi:hypothetical protein